MTKNSGAWTSSYFHSEYQPEEGDFLAPTTEHALLQLTDETELQVFSLDNGELVTGNLDDGFQALPFWENRTMSSEFQDHLDGHEVLKELSLGDIKLAAQKDNIWFLAPNLLSESVGHALIV